MTDSFAVLCNAVLMLAMGPMLIGENKPPLLSSVPTASGLSGLAVVWAVLGQAGASATCGIMAALWWATVAQVAARKIFRKAIL